MTHFVKAIAGILSWWYIEIVPSMLMADGMKAGIIDPTRVTRFALQNALSVAGLLMRIFLPHSLEARHLRAYKDQVWA